jgi:hypothetical protein
MKGVSFQGSSQARWCFGVTVSRRKTTVAHICRQTPQRCGSLTHLSLLLVLVAVVLGCGREQRRPRDPLSLEKTQISEVVPAADGAFTSRGKAQSGTRVRGKRSASRISPRGSLARRSPSPLMVERISIQEDPPGDSGTYVVQERPGCVRLKA